MVLVTTGEEEEETLPAPRYTPQRASPAGSPLTPQFWVFKSLLKPRRSAAQNSVNILYRCDKLIHNIIHNIIQLYIIHNIIHYTLYMSTGLSSNLLLNVSHPVYVDLV